jgi:hypothetical protein
VIPGTRCECRDTNDADHALHHMHGGMVFVRCQSDAVRLVTVREKAGDVNATDYNGPIYRKRAVPMCEPCATYHETKEGVR